MNNKSNISIIGGAGHVGFALGLIFSSKGFKVSLIDKHKLNIKRINSGKIPFLEEMQSKIIKNNDKKKEFMQQINLEK